MNIDKFLYEDWGCSTSMDLVDVAPEKIMGLSGIFKETSKNKIIRAIHELKNLNAFVVTETSVGTN